MGLMGWLPFWGSMPKLGEECKPGQAAKGSLVHYVEGLIQERIQDHPDQVDLRSMEDYVKSFDIVKRSGQDPCTYWISNCIQYYQKIQAPPSLAMSIASRTSDGDIGSSSSSSNTGSRRYSSTSRSIDAENEIVRTLFNHPLPRLTCSDSLIFLIFIVLTDCWSRSLGPFPLRLSREPNHRDSARSWSHPNVGHPRIIFREELLRSVDL